MLNLNLTHLNELYSITVAYIQRRGTLSDNWVLVQQSDLGTQFCFNYKLK